MGVSIGLHWHQNKTTNKIIKEQNKVNSANILIEINKPLIHGKQLMKDITMLYEDNKLNGGSIRRMLDYCEGMGTFYKDGIITRYQINELFGDLLERLDKRTDVQKYIEHVRKEDSTLYRQFSDMVNDIIRQN